MSIGPGEGDLMSKAFVKETDDEGDLPDESPAIPPGIKNYMTPEGHRRIAERIAPAIAD
jgi:transcription elongation factor GreB